MAAVSYGQIGSGSGSDWERFRSGSGVIPEQFSSGSVTSYNEFRLDLLMRSITCFT